MELEGVVHNGVIVPDDPTALPEGTRVRISPTSVEMPKPFGERFARFKGAAPGLPADLAEQHDRYRLGDNEAMRKEGVGSRFRTVATAQA
jgi:hypothetical protein